MTHLNIDLQGSGVTLSLLDSQLISYLPRLQSLVCHSYGKSNEDMDSLTRLSNQLRHFQFIRRGLSTNINVTHFDINHDIIIAVQETTNNKNSRRSLILHTVPYPNKVLHLPFVQWSKISSSCDYNKHMSDEGNALLRRILRPVRIQNSRNSEFIRF